jgi:hypothetical protein
VDGLVHGSQQPTHRDPLDGRPQLGQRSRILRHAVPRRVEGLDAGAAVALAGVQGRVGMEDELVAVGAVDREGGDPDGHRAGAGAALVAVDRGGEQVVGDELGRVEIAARQEQRELVASDAEGMVAATQVGAHDLGHGPEHLVAGEVSASVVGGLEVVDVDHQQGQRRRRRLGGRELTIELILERPMVAEPGQAVLHRVEPRPVVGVLERPAVVLEGARDPIGTSTDHDHHGEHEDGWAGDRGDVRDEIRTGQPEAAGHVDDGASQGEQHHHVGGHEATQDDPLDGRRGRRRSPSERRDGHPCS